MVAAGSGGQCDSAFRPLLADHLHSLIESSFVCACGIWSDFRIGYLSPGWFAFAAANGGEPAVSARWGLGADVLSGIQGPLREFFSTGFQRCIELQRPWEHCYECSSAHQYRRFQMMAYPLEERAGLLVVHSLRTERLQPTDKVAAAARLHHYADAHGIIHQCSYCRRVRRADHAEVWDWVPEWVEQTPPRTSHGICEACYGYYSPRLDKGLPFPEPLRTTDA